jgi:hypothetical protein
MNSHTIQQGFSAKKQIPYDVPPMRTGGQGVLSSRTPLLGLQKYELPPPIMNATNDYSMSSVVLGCHNLTSKTIRRPPGQGDGLQNPMGYARDQPRGLATLPGYVLNAPLLQPMNSAFGWMKSPLGN